MNEFQQEAAKLFHDFVQVERSDIFGPDDEEKWLPLHQVDDAKAMCPPFMGRNYERGGLIILSINPGGGTVTKHSADDDLYPKIHAFKELKDGIPDYYWKTFVPSFMGAAKLWKIDQGMAPILNASKTSLDGVCYFNFIPFRGRDNAYPASKADMAYIIPRCIKHLVKPALDFLKPSLIVTFGKIVDTYIDEYWQMRFEYERISWNRARARTPSVIKDREDAQKLLTAWAERYRARISAN